MARFSVDGMDELAADLEREALRAEKLVPTMLEAGAKVIVKAQKQEAEQMIQSGKIRFSGNDSRSTGAFIASIKPTSIKGKGAKSYVEVYPQGSDKKKTPVRNAEKGFLAEYGTRSMPSYPWMSVANEKAMPGAVEKMQEIWNKED